MRYSTSLKTYTPDDCTSTGWHVQSNRTTVRLERRTRWQGARNGIVVMKAIDGPLTEEQARDMAEQLHGLIGTGQLAVRRGEEANGFRVVSTGYMVR